MEKEDIQGLLIRGYGKLPHATYLLLRIDKSKDAKNYLKALKVTPAEVSPAQQAIHVAFTNTGMQQLGLPEAAFHTFSRQFKEGMAEKVRNHILGDNHANAPEHWLWGNEQNPRIDMVLLIYAVGEADLEQLVATEEEKLTINGLSVIQKLNTNLLKDGKEHFGFKDGISQPVIKGLPKADEESQPWNIMPEGEFILGYRDIYDQYPDAPSVEKTVDSNNFLPFHDNGNKDLGKNGSYFVFRQMHQDVTAFWGYLKNHSREEGNNEEAKAVKLAAKMVGRWPNGNSLVKYQENEPESPEGANEFAYWKEDFNGNKCPIGSHIRRTNPRDWLLTEKTQLESTEMIQKHRLLRRGRPYGPAMADSMEPEDLMKAQDDGQARGLHFQCFCVDIRRQFEFVQNAWVRFHKFGGLYEDADPLIGTHYEEGPIKTNKFTVQAEPFRRRYHDLPQFVKMVGGAYFFFPGIRAIQFLAHLPEQE